MPEDLARDFRLQAERIPLCCPTPFPMATIKVACPKCGQKVSGDESFYGAVVECPICSASIQFPGKRPAGSESPRPSPTEEKPVVSSLPRAGFGDSDIAEAVPQTVQEPVGRPIDESVPADQPSISEPQGEDEDYVPTPLAGAISLVAAVLAVVTCPLAIFFAPVAIISGHISQAAARRSAVQPAPGQTIGAIGMMVGYVCLVLAILFLGLAVVFKEPLAEWIRAQNTAS